MKQLTINDLENLSLGSALLGSGGGGDTAYVLLMTKYLMEKYGPVDVISLEELKEEDYVVPLSFMGAPLIGMERVPSGRELEALLYTLEKRIERKPTVLMAAEIGGANAFTPLLIAAKMGLPVLDADMIGRAFPLLQMSSCYLKNLNATPAVMADCLGNTVVIETLTAVTLEKMARSITVSMGSSAAIGFYLMDGRAAQEAVVGGTLSLALTLGQTISTARKEGRDTSLALVESTSARVMGRGSIIDIEQEIREGFLHGSVTLLCEGKKIKLLYQNEYLLAQDAEGAIAATPDLLVLLEESSGTALSTEGLRYGLQVTLMVFSAPPIWQTEKGLKLVGPKAFGL